tara:strand:+ start:35 stop:1711 length:1677 start_codon:yes stop_codon:yes gene_type:complete
MAKAALITMLVLCAHAAAQAPAQAPAQDPFEQLTLRVSQLRPNGQCIVDRGKRDLLQVDDRVVLSPRGGPTLPGRVTQVEGRTALVQLLDPKAKVVAGTRGYALVPKSRLKPVAKPQPTSPNEPAEPPPAAKPGQAAEDEWRPGMPLLGRHRAPRPNERASQMRGRLFGSGNLVRTLDSFSHSYVRGGADVDINNVDGDGGRLRFHGEMIRSEEFNSGTGNDVRIYEISYEQGGTRFNPMRWQAGRFLQRDMPEFGLLDGIEVGYRQENGSRFGASFGYLPELDDDMDTLADLQIAVWYIWNQDLAERVTYGIGYQKSWHRFDGDRDLFVLKARYLPNDGWDVSSSLWVDIYDNDDVLKDETFEFTRANLFASRRSRGEGGMEFFYDHEEYPELLRTDNPQTLLPQTLIGAHVDRVSAHMWMESEARNRVFTRLTGWVDEEVEGGAAEFGFEVVDWFSSGSRSTLALFHTDAPTSNVSGIRVQHGGSHSYGRLDVLYELGFAHFDDNPSATAELLQHRLGALVTTDFGSGWDATFSADATLWDEEFSFGLGIYLQRLF